MCARLLRLSRSIFFMGRLASVPTLTLRVNASIKKYCENIMTIRHCSFVFLINVHNGKKSLVDYATLNP